MTDREAASAWGALTDARRDDVTRVFVNIGKAIAAYERRIEFGPSRFDKYVDAITSGQPGPSSLTDDEIAGLRLFVGRANCTQCHNGPEMRKVAVKSCGGAEGCHVTATLDDGGILNYEIDQRNKSAKFVCTKCHVEFGNKAVPESHLRAIPKPAVAFAHAVFEPTDFSQFKHDNRNHARLPCLLCHRRENNSPQPTLPGKAAHAPCTGCHAQQFANSSSEICTICHTDVQSGKVKAFPPLRSFDARFDHSKHAGAACATCHRRNRGGVGLSIPARQNAHVTCFSCHTPNAQANGRNISSCSTCHQLGRLVRTSEQARAFRVGFSHANHDASEKLSCGACHQVRGQVSAPLPLNHHAPARAFSCASCHNGQRAFGGDDFSACKRCHKGTTWAQL